MFDAFLTMGLMLAAAVAVLLVIHHYKKAGKL